MRMCGTHWGMLRESVKKFGMWHLVSSSGEEAHARLADELESGDIKKNFDPLMSHNTHWMGTALECGGLYLMGLDGPKENEWHFCPICELASHYSEFYPQSRIDDVSGQMLTWARAEGVMPRVS